MDTQRQAASSHSKHIEKRALMSANTSTGSPMTPGSSAPGEPAPSLAPGAFSSRWSAARTYCIDVLRSGSVGSVGSVAFEGEVIFGPEKQRHLSFPLEPVGKSIPGSKSHLRIWRVDVVNGNSPLNTSKSKTSRLVLFVFKNSHTPVLWLK